MVQNNPLNNAINFLMWSYFKLTLDDGDKVDRILGICIQKAYSDATQQGAYNALIGKNENELRNFSETAECKAGKVLLNQIHELKEEECGKDFFNGWHKTTCGLIQNQYGKVNEDKERFSYGNAQKWVNMTLKYIYTLYWLFPPSVSSARNMGEL